MHFLQAGLLVAPRSTALIASFTQLGQPVTGELLRYLGGVNLLTWVTYMIAPRLCLAGWILTHMAIPGNYAIATVLAATALLAQAAFMLSTFRTSGTEIGHLLGFLA